MLVEDQGAVAGWTSKVAMRAPDLNADRGFVPGATLLYLSDREGLIRGCCLGADPLGLEKRDAELLV